MPSTSIRLRPGVDTLATPALNEAGISASNLIRFRGGLVEKRGGWTIYATGIGFAPRVMCTYTDVDGAVSLAVAGYGYVKVIVAGVQVDISPRWISDSGAVSVSTTSGSKVVTITDGAASVAVGDTVWIVNAISVGGIVLSGSYTVISNAVLQNYNIQHTVAATSTVTNGGTIATISTTAGSAIGNFLLSGASSAYQVGGTITIPSTTVGGVTVSGTYRVTALPDANTVAFQMLAAALSSDSALLRNANTSFGSQYIYTIVNAFGAAKRGNRRTAVDWSICAYGTDLIAAAYQGSIYRWSKTQNTPELAVLPNAPAMVTGAFVADAQQMIVAYGVYLTSSQDNNTVAWCDAGGPTIWTASSTNQAGSYRLPTGSGIVGGGVADGKNLLWTDVDVWAMTYVGYPLVWGFNKLATGCGLVAQGAWAKLGGAIYWMSQNEFWMYNGASVVPLPCSVRDKIFGNIAAGQSYKIKAGGNSQFNEVMWFFPSSTGPGENDSYVCYNPVEGTWDYGSMARSAWIDQSELGSPVGADRNGNVYLHETGPDAAGTAIQASFTTGWTLIQDGEDFAFVDLIRPDINFPTGAGTVQLSVLTCAYTTDAPTVAGPFSITAATEFINMRCRGRYVALQFASSDLGSSWRLGRVQLRFASSGRR